MGFGFLLIVQELSSINDIILNFDLSNEYIHLNMIMVVDRPEFSMKIDIVVHLDCFKIDASFTIQNH